MICHHKKIIHLQHVEEIFKPQIQNPFEMNMDKPRVEEHGMGDWENPSQELLDSMEQIKKDFSVDTAKLKEITNKFEEELQNGLDNHDSNIVSTKVPNVILTR